MSGPSEADVVAVLDSLRKSIGMTGRDLSRQLDRRPCWWGERVRGVAPLPLADLLAACEALGVLASDVLALAEFAAARSSAEASTRIRVSRADLLAVFERGRQANQNSETR